MQTDKTVDRRNPRTAATTLRIVYARLPTSSFSSASFAAAAAAAILNETLLHTHITNDVSL